MEKEIFGSSRSGWPKGRVGGRPGRISTSPAENLPMERTPSSEIFMELVMTAKKRKRCLKSLLPTTSKKNGKKRDFEDRRIKWHAKPPATDLGCSIAPESLVTSENAVRSI